MPHRNEETVGAVRVGGGKREVEVGSLAGNRVAPDTPTVTLDDPLVDVELDRRKLTSDGAGVRRVRVDLALGLRQLRTKRGVVDFGTVTWIER